MPISPNQGSTGGGTTVTITGTNLGSATAVKFGSKPATITSNTPTSVTVTSPSGSGTAPVTVTTAAGASNPLNFYYIGAPFKASLSAASGPSAGGNTVTISGIGLATASSVAFGGNNATPTVTSDSLLNVTVPAGTSGSVGVSVTTTGGTNNGFSYTYVDVPTIIELAPTSGSTSGGTAVTITGTELATTESVTFDGVTAPFAVVNSTTLSVVTPPGTAGAVDVVVNTTGGGVTAAGGFTYVASPGI
ncbi:IPT/TIG domain-containing protein [Streptomyces lunaelactis]|uniref:IPT/TIG domain-containing protein n=1 Tax=Streptomyces lunaelactis TaxID=1535768 RepID=UPI001584E6BF|nr:IPT/TIG domain-containing protein [Streptomyces lunaelactis]NUL03064.1 IPT/TIG domain-containing protein [Streptomyces lunaelactis]